MGKGDKKTYKGKLFKGSYGKKRPNKRIRELASRTRMESAGK